MPYHVLVVEDNDPIFELFEIVLTRAGFRLSRARTGGEAIASAEGLDPDLVLLDVGLPDMDGIDLMIRLKSDPGTSHLPFVCVSGHATAEDAARALEAGSVQYLTKPINTRTLAQELLDLLEALRRPGTLQ